METGISEPELGEQLPGKEIQVLGPVARVFWGKVWVKGLGEFVGIITHCKR